MDGVLVDYDPRVRVAHLAAAIQRSPQAVHAAIYGSGIEAAGDRGALSAIQYLAALGENLRCEVPLDAWVAARRAATTIRPDHLTAVENVAGHAQIALLTNNGLLLAAQWPAIVPELFPLFSGRAYAAAQFGVSKPSPAVYLACLEVLGVTPADTVFIDDHLPNVIGARQAGLTAWHYTDAKNFHALLEQL